MLRDHRPPPVPPRTGSFGGRERLVLRSDAEFAATFARSTRDHAPGVAILPDVRGLHPYYEALADALADAGVHALAIDLYGRTAGPEHREEGFDHAPHRAAARDVRARRRGDRRRSRRRAPVASRRRCSRSTAARTRRSAPRTGRRSLKR